MISIEQYNDAESLAISLLPNLYEYNKWGKTSETESSIVWVKELGELQVLLNRFQCDRFRSYLFELGGLSKDDLTIFNTAKDVVLDIQRRYYSQLDPVVPVETLLSAFTIYRKIKSARPEVKSILEIGPGAGLNSLFFSQDRSIKYYTQVEATQATYLSQAMVNERCYGLSVCEMAISTGAIPGDKDICCHVPWWRVDEIYNMAVSYDVITANACLNEISNEMLDRYLNLFAEKSHPETLLLLQDLGDFMFRSDKDLRERLSNAGWFLAVETTNWDIERVLCAMSGAMIKHGDAVTTWWLTRDPGKFVAKLDPRYVAGSAMVRADWLEFKHPGSDQTWTRDDLAKIQ